LEGDVKRAILILDIGMDSVGAGIFPHKKTKPLCLLTHPLRRKGVLSEKEDIKNAVSSILAIAKGKGFGEFQRVFVSIPAREISIRILSIPFENKKQIEDVLPYELDGLLPYASGEMMISALLLGDNRIFAAALERTRIKQYLELLKELGLDPFWLGSTLFSMGNLLSRGIGENGEDSGVSVIVNRDSMLAVVRGMPVFFKPLDTVEEIKIALACLEAEGFKADKFYAPDEMIHELKPLLSEIGDTPHFSPLILRGEEGGGEGYDGDGAGIIALSLQIQKGLEGTINFRRGELEYTGEKFILKRSLKVAGLILLFIGGLLAGDIYLRYAALDREYGVLKDDLKERYFELFPSEIKVVDELYQLESRLKIISEDLETIGGGAGVLEIMKGLSQGAAHDGSIKVKLYEINIGDGRAAVRGEVDSFEDANLLKSSLEKNSPFRKILLTDVKSNVKGGATFSLSITLN
jgi:hypothetical protein